MVKIIKMVLHCIVRADDLDREREFKKQVAKLTYGAHDSRAQLAEHVLYSIVGPSGVPALPLAAGINVVGHYKWHFFLFLSFFLSLSLSLRAHC